jgi:DNA-binding response OmpR family regulator
MTRVLVIDDDDLVRQVCRLILEDEGFEVDTAADGADGLRKFHAHPAEVVVCDIYMPEKDGIETIVELSKEYHGLKIIAMSGDAPGRLSLIASARSLGAHATLPKPFEPDELVNAVRSVTDEAG